MRTLRGLFLSLSRARALCPLFSTPNVIVWPSGKWPPREAERASGRATLQSSQKLELSERLDSALAARAHRTEIYLRASSLRERALCCSRARALSVSLFFFLVSLSAPDHFICLPARALTSLSFCIAPTARAAKNARDNARPLLCRAFGVAQKFTYISESRERARSQFLCGSRADGPAHIKLIAVWSLSRPVL